jgi:hypothetical protein
LDPATLGTAAFAAAASYLAELGKEVAKSTAGELRKWVWDGSRASCLRPVRKRRQTLRSRPAIPTTDKAAEAALAKFLKFDPGPLSALAQLIEEAGGTSAISSARSQAGEARYLLTTESSRT